MRLRLYVCILTVVVATAAIVNPIVAVSPSPASPGPASPGPASPDPGSSPPGSPTPSPTAGPADCGPTAAILPPFIDGLPVDTTITVGVAAVDPDELLDPLLGSLGRTRDDICVVAFRYGDGSEVLAGQLLRIAGVDATDLAARFLGALRERLVAYGAEASPSMLDADGQLVLTLDVTAAGQRTQIVAHQLGDTLLVTSGRAAMDRLLPLLFPEALPAPSTAPSGPEG